MSDRMPPVYFSQRELHAPKAGRDAARDISGRPSPEPFWTVPHSPSTDRPSEMDSCPSMYAGPPCVGGGSMAHHVSVGIASSPSVLQSRHAEMRSAHMHVHAQAGTAVVAVPFAGPSVHQLDCSWPGPNPFGVVQELRDNPQSLRNVGAPSHDTTKVPASGFPPTDQTWKGMVGAGSATPRAHPALPLQVRPQWEPSGPTHIQSPSFNGSDTPAVEPALPQNAEDDDDVYTFLCEWTDEHGTCNMAVFGDRVWMSHHLSRQHNVIGHERSQRACLWRGCTDTMNKGSLARHVVSRHLRAGASCGFCSKVYSRADVARRHTKKCKVANGAMGQRDQTKW